MACECLLGYVRLRTEAYCRCRLFWTQLPKAKERRMNGKFLPLAVVVVGLSACTSYPANSSYNSGYNNGSA